MKIALAELLCFVGLAAAESSSWHGEIIAYATDNQNVRSWLTKRQSRCTVARHILRVLGMLEVRFHFKTLAFYIRTYHNITADWLSRETKMDESRGAGEMGVLHRGVRERHLQMAWRGIAGNSEAGGGAPLSTLSSSGGKGKRYRVGQGASAMGDSVVMFGRPCLSTTGQPRSM